VGGPTALITYGPLRILTDPTFDPPADFPRPGTKSTLHKLSGPSIAEEDVLPVDLVLLSHDHHSDNLDAAGRELLERVPRVITTTAGAERLGRNADGLQPGEWLELHDGITVIAVRADHGSPGVAPKNGPVIGFVLQGAGLPRTYISGDNASVDVVAEIVEEEGPFDIAVLFAGGAEVPEIWGPDVLLTLDARRAVEAAAALGDAIVVPIHQEGWAHLTSGPGELERAFVTAGIGHRLRQTRPGMTVSFLPN
jgi:L-ascorbate metabolism protein UlaG (beta-lactamase superfamily)